jgi:hypothetical protein
MYIAGAAAFKPQHKHRRFRQHFAVFGNQQKRLCVILGFARARDKHGPDDRSFQNGQNRTS